MIRLCGLYKIQSRIKPERVYIGSAVNISKRWSLHLTELKMQRHHSKKLQNHYNKYGSSDLQFSVLLGCERYDLIKIEQYFIDSYNPYFNICKIAGNVLGRKHTEETKQKMRKSKSPEHIKHISEGLTGKKASKESIEKNRKGHLGKTQSLESNIKRSQTLKGRNTWAKGNTNRRGQKASEETKKKLSAAWEKRKLTPMSELTRNKLRIAMLGNKNWIRKIHEPSSN